jgi:hypothetical protein
MTSGVNFQAGSGSLYNFTIQTPASGSIPYRIRVGVMIDGLDSSAPNPSAIYLQQIAGASWTSAVIDTTGALYNNRQPDWLFFDIVGAQAGDQYQVYENAGLTSAGQNSEQITLQAVSFDSQATNTPPLQITVTNPTNGQAFSTGASITGTTTVTKGTPPYTVTFYTNSAGGAYGLAGVVSSSPYTVTLGMLAAGTYGIYATATDSATPTPATSTSATNGPNDTFSVVIPTPTLSGIATLRGTSFSISFSGFTGQGYTVLMTTNLALPLESWTPLTNGTFGASPVDFTDTHATNAAQFYRIMSP